MVAIISSQALGLFNSSLSQLGANSPHGQSQMGQAGDNIFVNAANGNLVVQRQDDGLQGLGVDASFLRTYNSLGELNGQHDGDNHDDWRLGFSRQITAPAADQLQRTTAGGGLQQFSLQSVAANGDRVFTSTAGDGADDTLIEHAAGGYVFTEGTSQAQEHYNAAGRLESIVDREGKGLHFSYRGAESSLVDFITIDTLTAGVATVDTVAFDYVVGQNNAYLLSGYTLHRGEAAQHQKVAYQYDDHDRLTVVTIDLTLDNQTDGVNYTTTYGYRDADGSSNLLAFIANSDGTRTAFDYYRAAEGHTDKIKSVTDGEGKVTRFSYDEGTRTTTATIDGTDFKYRYDNQVP